VVSVSDCSEFIRAIRTKRVMQVAGRTPEARVC